MHGRSRDKEAARILGDLARNPLGVGEDQDFRISLAGAQEKTALLYWKDKWQVPHGTTATTHIIKPQIGTLPNGIDLTNSVENEHFCLELVAALGLARGKIADRRFRRPARARGRAVRPPMDARQAAAAAAAGGLLPGALGAAGAQIRIRRRSRHSSRFPNLLKGSDTPDDDRRTFLKAQMVFWLLGATDGHAKNFSLRLAPGGRFRLTPLYDIISTQPSLDAGQIRQNQMKLAMAVGDSRHYVVHTISGRHFLQTAKRCGLPDKMVKEAIAELIAIVPSRLAKTVAALPPKFPAKLTASIVDAANALAFAENEC